LVNPIGIDVVHPRLTWQLQESRIGAAQTAYRIYVDTGSAALNTTKAIFWTSDKINSSANLVTYQGKQLQAFTKYFWRIAVWNKNGQQSRSPIHSFEMGKNILLVPHFVAGLDNFEASHE